MDALIEAALSLGAIGDKPGDSEDEKLRHRLLVFMGVAMSGGGLLWGSLSLAVGAYVQAAIPFGYVVITAFNLLLFRATRNFGVVRFIQVFASLALPFMFQWVLGGFQASGAVMLWAMLAIVGSLTFSGQRWALIWLGIYSLFVVISGLVDGSLAGLILVESDQTRTVFFVINIVVISNIVFGLTIYQLRERDLATDAARQANTERAQLNERLKGALAQSGAILESIADGLVAVDAEGRIQAANPALSLLLDIDSDLVGRSVRDALPEAVARLAQESRQTRRVVKDVIRLRSDGVGSALASPVMLGEGQDAHEVGAVVVVRDVTLEKEAERVRSQFLANMSHEIRTPMNAVIGMTELLQRTPLNGKQQRYVDVIGSCGESLLSLINDILDLSKIEAGRFQLVHQDFDLPEALEQTASMLAKQGEEKGLALICRVDPTVPRRVRGDVERLRQILINLIGNAIKFTDRGEVNLEAKLVSDENGRYVVHFDVRDTGIGIAQADQESLFELFTQVDPSSTRSYGGTGLGTTIAKQLTELMGGEIGVQSALGVGSRFWFTVDFAHPESEAEARPALREVRGLQVLVIERNPTIREVLESYLSSWNIDVQSAETGKDGEALWGRRDFGLVLVDLDLVDQDPAELAQRAVDKGLVAVALGELEDLEASPFSVAISKPVRQSALFDALVGLFGTRRERKPVRSRSEGGSGRVLLAEDNPINQELAVDMLEELGYTVTVADNGEQAVAAVEREEFLAVFMDCQMPVMDGYEATRTIRERWPDRRIPIVALTAHALPEDRQQALDAGMDDHLTKPVTLRVLRETLTRWTGAVETHSDPSQPARSDQKFDGLPEALANKPRVIAVFAEHVPEQVKAVRHAMEAGDTEALDRALHTLKGGLLMCGLTELGQSCEGLRGKGIEDARAKFAPIERECMALAEAARQALD